MGKKDQFPEEYQKLRSQLAQIGYICTGSIMNKYLKCGRLYCRCVKENKAIHGPYNIWTRKVKGKTVTRHLTDTQTTFCRKCVQNMRRLESIIEKMKELTAKYIEEHK